MFQHFILTHFNTKFKWSKKGVGRSDKNKLPENWMERRLKLFEKYCYPSIANQTNQNFEWLVLFDEERTDKSKIKRFNKMTPVFLSDYDYLKKGHFIKAVRDRLKPKTEWLITSRLDNDDSYNQDYVKEVQDRFEEREKFINFVNGAIYEIMRKDLRLFAYRSPNPFLSTIEPVRKNKKIKTCFGIEHPRMGVIFKSVDQVEIKKLMWLQIIHNENLGNTLRGKQTKYNLKEFNIHV